MKRFALVAVLLIALGAAPAASAGLRVDLGAAGSNPTRPQMGDHLTFRSTISNADPVEQEGVIAWLSLVRVDKGHEQPVDLEDWSAHKAVTRDRLATGEQVVTDWPMRLIQAGQYRVVVGALSRKGGALTPSQFVDFSVDPKPVVESARVLPVAFGVPGLLLAFMLFGRWRNPKKDTAKG